MFPYHEGVLLELGTTKNLEFSTPGFFSLIFLKPMMIIFLSECL